MKIGPAPLYEGMTVTTFTLPPSEVKQFHPDAKPGEFYAACQNRKTHEYWTLGPFKTHKEARAAICEEALERADTGILSSVEVVEERSYRMNIAGPKILGLLDYISDEDAKICFDWALEQRRKRAS